jgi:tetratricopeptide (TPR) repeat protein
VTEHTAVQLFLQSAHRVQKNLNLHADDLTHLSIICQLVEGMPLALELAAGWVDVLSLAEIGTEISHGLDVLETEVRNVPQRQRSLRVLFDNSWRRLSREEREVLNRFSLFRGGCTREAAQAITSASLRLLANLANKSLIQYRQQNGRYYIHALLRQYAAEKLAMDPIVAASAGDSHCAYYCATLGQWENELKSARQAMTVVAICEDYDNMRAAWEWGVVNNKLADLAIALNSWGEYHEVSGHWPEGEMIFQTTAETIQATNDFITEPSAWIPLWVSLQAWQIKFSLNRTLQILEYQGQLEKLLKQSLELLAGLASNGETFPAEEALVRLQLGRLQKYGSQQKIEEGRFHLEAGLHLYRKMGDKVGLADALFEIGWCDIDSHLFKQAREFMRESQTILREVGDLWRLTRILFGLGFCAKALEDFDEALEIFTQLSTTLTSLQTFGNVIGLAHSLMNLDSNLVHLGKYAEAQVLAKKYLAIYNDLGTEQELAYANTVASFPLLYLGQYTAAREQAQKGLDLGQKLNQQEAMEWSSMILGWVALAEQVYDEASQRLQESIVIGQELGDIPNVGQAKATLALAMRGLGNHTDAQRCLIEALRTAKEERNKNKYIYLILVKTVPTIALLLADQNDKVRAVELYALAQTHPMVANGQWFQDVVGQYIEDVAATLQADVVTAAKTRGQASNLWKTAEKLLQELTELGWDKEIG